MICLNTISCTASTAINMGRKSNTNFYEVLKLESEDVNSKDIRKAYRGLALQYHPDICPPSMKDEYTRKFVELRCAYEILSDSSLRRKHNLELRMCELGMDHQETDGFYAQPVFSREVWEVQLVELMRRSERRESVKARFC